jgi:hypothetical protein
MMLTYGSQLDYDGMSGQAEDSPWTPELFGAMGAFMEKFNHDLEESGELVETRGLGAPVHTRRLRLENGVPVVTDGPFAETEEVLAGYWIIECDGIDRAMEIAGRLSECPGPEGVRDTYYVDLRPIMEGRDELGL